MPIVLRLWDMLIAVDDPAFIFFIGLQLLTRLRGPLLLSDTEMIPEVISKIGFTGEEDVDNIVKRAVESYHNSPRCFRRTLRLCSVTNPELSPITNFYSNLTMKANKLRAQINRQRQRQRKRQATNDQQKLHTLPSVAGTTTKKLTAKQLRLEKAELKRRETLDLAMAVQSVRSCVMMSAAELVDALTQYPMPTNPSTQDSVGDMFLNRQDPDEQGQGFTHSIRVERPTQIQQHIQYMLIDCRAVSECDQIGAGLIPKAIIMEPSLLDNSAVLEPWLQHLDSLKGCHIVIIDMPVIKLPGRALIRRLLFGEYDGLSPSSAIYGQYNRGSASSGDNNMASTNFQRDEESPYAVAEEEIIIDDLNNRPGIRLAQALQQAHFPYVSVLEKGFPSLVAQLMHVRGDVEPIIINHDHVKWSQYMIWVKKQQQQPAPSLSEAADSDGGNSPSVSRKKGDRHQSQQSSSWSTLFSFGSGSGIDGVKDAITDNAFFDDDDEDDDEALDFVGVDDEEDVDETGYGSDEMAGREGSITNSSVTPRTRTNTPSSSEHTPIMNAPDIDTYQDSPTRKIQRKSVEMLTAAYRVASRLGHANMEAIFLDRLGNLGLFTTGSKEERSPENNGSLGETANVGSANTTTLETDLVVDHEDKSLTDLDRQQFLSENAPTQQSRLHDPVHEPGQELVHQSIQERGDDPADLIASLTALSEV
jgi:hypothetical protein